LPCVVGNVAKVNVVSIDGIAQEVGCWFIKMSSTQLISGVSGDSEERIRDLFDIAVVTILFC